MRYCRLILLLLSILPTVLTGAESPVIISIEPETVGKAIPLVGYNQGHFLPGSNTSNWLRYAGVNVVRFWASTNVYVEDGDLDRAEVADFTAFERRKAALRQSPESHRFLNWPAIQKRFDTLVYPGSNRYVLNPVLDELRKLQITPVAQLHSGRWGDTWQNHWMQWQRFYAVAYHLARYGDVEMFMMFNEPDHPGSGGYSVDQYIVFLQIASDAIHAAVEDVNSRYGKGLSPKILAPVTAGLPTSDWGKKPVAHLRTGLNEVPLDRNLFHIFANHRYGPTWDHYAREIDAMKAMMSEHSPTGEVLPIMYTEWGRHTTRRWHSLEESLDTPYVSRDIAAIYGAALEGQVLGMITFKFNNTSRAEYPGGMKSGHHFVREEDDYDTTGARRTSEVVRLFAKGFSGNRVLLQTTVKGSKDLQAWTTFDKEQNLYRLWCVNLKNDSALEVSIDVSHLGLEPGAFAIVEEISGEAFGEVTAIARVSPEKTIPLNLPQHGVALVSVGARPLTHRRVATSASTTIALTSSSNDFRGSENTVLRRSASETDSNAAVLLRFSLPVDNRLVEHALLRVHSPGATREVPAVVQVHLIPNLPWRAGSPAGEELAKVISSKGYVSGAGFRSIPAGHLTFDNSGGYRTADISPALRYLAVSDFSVLLIAPLRQPEDRAEGEVEVPFSMGEDSPLVLDLLLSERAAAR